MFLLQPIMLRLLFILPLFFFVSDKAVPVKLVYHIDEKSQLFLTGTTSVNDFACDCKDKFQPAILEGEINPANRQLSFKNARLNIKTKLLSCKNNLMNRDMHKALKAEEHPYIFVDIVNATPLHTEKELQTGKQYSYDVVTVIHIAGISKAQMIQVKMQRIKDHYYKLTAEKQIKMSDYDIKPRTPFNIIKIDDNITIHFELLVNADK